MPDQQPCWRTPLARHARHVRSSCATRLWGTDASRLHELQTRAAEPSLRHEVTEVLDAMVATGLTVLRTWAFNDGEAQWNALQPRPGAGSLHSCVADPALVKQPTRVASTSLQAGRDSAVIASIKQPGPAVSLSLLHSHLLMQLIQRPAPEELYSRTSVIVQGSSTTTCSRGWTLCWQRRAAAASWSS
jgi:hypothetical protein